MKCEECGDETELLFCHSTGEYLCYHCILELAKSYFHHLLLEQYPMAEEKYG